MREAAVVEVTTIGPLNGHSTARSAKRPPQLRARLRGWLHLPVRRGSRCMALAQQRCHGEVGDGHRFGGGEGMVVEPLDFVPPGRGRVQPAIKVRGREYLWIICGPEYTVPEHLDRLSDCGLRASDPWRWRSWRSTLDGFVWREPLRRAHECVVGVLTLESEAIDRASKVRLAYPTVAGR